MKKTVTAIVLAAGQGKRMNSDVQKQYLLLQQRPVLYYSLKCFQDSPLVDSIILVTGESELEYCQQEIVEKYEFTKIKRVVAGGKERYDSVEHGLQAIDDANAIDIVMIHDGARPFVTNEMLERSIRAVEQWGACTVGMPVKDTIKVVDANGVGIDTPDRSTLWQIQTPQSFEFGLIEEAYIAFRQSDCTGITDDTMLVEKFCKQSVKVVEGDYQNIKITTPEDMILAEAFLNKKR